MLCYYNNTLKNTQNKTQKNPQNKKKPIKIREKTKTGHGMLLSISFSH